MKTRVAGVCRSRSWFSVAYLRLLALFFFFWRSSLPHTSLSEENSLWHLKATIPDSDRPAKESKRETEKRKRKEDRGQQERSVRASLRLTEDYVVSVAWREKPKVAFLFSSSLRFCFPDVVDVNAIFFSLLSFFLSSSSSSLRRIFFLKLISARAYQWENIFFRKKPWNFQ